MRSEHEPLRNLSVDAVVFLSAHASALDVEMLDQAWRDFNPQVFFPEMGGWSENDALIYQNISKGVLPVQIGLAVAKWSPEQPFYDTVKREMEILYDTYVGVEFIDIPDGHPLLKKMYECLPPISARVDRATREIKHFVIDHPFADAVGAWASYLQEFERIQEEREAYIVQHFAEIVSGIGVKHLRVLLQLGDGHKRLVQTLRDMGVNVTAVFGQKPITNYQIAALAMYRYGRQPNELILARGLLGTMIQFAFGNDLDRVHPDSNLQLKFVTDKIRQLSTDQCRRLFDALTSPYGLRNAKDRIEDFFAREGLNASFLRDFQESYAKS